MFEARKTNLQGQSMKPSEIKDPVLRAKVLAAYEAAGRRTEPIQPTVSAVVGKSLNGTLKRIRQSSKPLMNGLESEYFQILQADYRNVRPQAMRFKLGNGIWYKPDFTYTHNMMLTCVEVKGPHAFRGGFENLKVAAGLYPEFNWLLVWKQDGVWKEQKVLS